MRSNKEQLKARGYSEDNELDLYMNTTREQLFDLLQSKLASDRTIAAKLLVKYKDIEVAKILMAALIIETKLYTKIVLSEALGKYGEEVSILLIKYLGKVGHNQYKELPSKLFNKKNYPLPRDIIARTLCKIGKPAINPLRRSLNYGEHNQILEAIDAIGYISYYCDDFTCLNNFIELLHKNRDDDLMTWKLIRALQAFIDENTIELLKEYTISNIKQHRWEAMRSIEQINRRLLV